jgi:ABC-type Fe3+ transport system substrate-binding protein
MGYNTDLVKPQMPKSFADLLEPKWTGKIVKAHPSYSGTILTGDLPDRARHWLAVFREARPAEGHAGAVRLRSAQEARARRARHHG